MSRCGVSALNTALDIRLGYALPMAKRVSLPQNRIRELRIGRGLSLEELGARCNPPMNKSQIQKRELGETQVSIEDMLTIAEVLDVHPADLLPMPPYSPRERALLQELRELQEADQD